MVTAVSTLRTLLPRDSLNPVNAMLVEAENILLTIDRPDTKICVLRLGGIYAICQCIKSLVFGITVDPEACRATFPDVDFGLDVSA